MLKKRVMLLPLKPGTDPSKVTWKMAKFISMVIGMSSHDPEKGGLRPTSWTNIHSTKINEELGRGYKRVVDAAIEIGSVLWNKSYCTGGFGRKANPMSYKIPREAMGWGLTKCVFYVDVPDKPKPAGKPRKKEWQPKDRDWRSGTKAREIISNGNRHIEQFKEMQERTTVEPEMLDQAISDYEKSDKGQKAWSRMLQSQSVFYAINDNCSWAKVCIGGRLHTPITSMPGDAKKYLRIDGEHVATSDVSNSQPLLIGSIMREWSGLSDAEIAGKLRTIDMDICEHQGFQGICETQDEVDAYRSNQRSIKTKSFSRRLKIEDNIGRACTWGQYEKGLRERALVIWYVLIVCEGEMDKYIELTESGTLYEYMMDAISMPGVEGDAGRKRVKTANMPCLYERPRTKEQAEAELAIQRKKYMEWKRSGKAHETGGITAKMVLAKFRVKDREEFYPKTAMLNAMKAVFHSGSPIYIQREEAKLMLGIDNTLTVHDSVLFKVSDTQEVMTQLRKRFSDAGIKTNLKVVVLNGPGSEDEPLHLPSLESWKSKRDRRELMSTPTIKPRPALAPSVNIRLYAGNYTSPLARISRLSTSNHFSSCLAQQPDRSETRGTARSFLRSENPNISPMWRSKNRGSMTLCSGSSRNGDCRGPPP